MDVFSFALLLGVVVVVIVLFSVVLVVRDDSRWGRFR